MLNHAPPDHGPPGPPSIGEAAGPGPERDPAADDVQTLVISDYGHWVAEQVLAALTTFLAPYRNEPGHGA